MVYKSVTSGHPVRSLLHVETQKPLSTGRATPPRHCQGKSMNETVDDLTLNYEEDGVLIVKETGKEVLSKGAWATILYRYSDIDRKTGEYGKDKYSIRRYQKQQGEYRQKSKFNISSTEQAKKIISALSSWIDEQ